MNQILPCYLLAFLFIFVVVLLRKEERGHIVAMEIQLFPGVSSATASIWWTNAGNISRSGSHYLPDGDEANDDDGSIFTTRLSQLSITAVMAQRPSPPGGRCCRWRPQLYSLYVIPSWKSISRRFSHVDRGFLWPPASEMGAFVCVASDAMECYFGFSPCLSAGICLNC